MKKTTLGRGLDALIPKETARQDTQAGSGFIVAGVEEVSPNRSQPRKEFEQGAIEELAASIKEKGIIQPLVVRNTQKGYEIIAGERRWRAAQMAGLTKVPIIVKEATDREVLELALIENLQREDLNPIEEAKKNEEVEERAVVVSKTDAKQITTLIGESCVFEGNVTTTSSTRIDGQLKGKIAGEYSLIVGENGVVEGEIKAAETVVYGKVEGVIESGNLEIKSSGTVNGDVFIESLTVEKGATLNGRCEMTASHENVVFESNGPGTKELASGTIDVEETT